MTIQETPVCDIKGERHTGKVLKKKVPVMFDHDQEDGKSKTEPYFELAELDICEAHFLHMGINRKVIYAYGAMGYNEYYL